MIYTHTPRLAAAVGSVAALRLCAPGQILDHERIRLAFPADCRVRPVPRVHDRGVAKRKQHLGNRPHQDSVVAAGQIGAANRARKQRVADEQVRARLALSSDLQADAARAVAGRVVDADLVIAKRDRGSGRSTHRSAAAGGPRTEQLPLLDRMFVQRQIVLMEIDRHVQRLLHLRHAGDVVDVRMGQQDVRDVDAAVAHRGEQLVGLVAGVDHDRFVRPFAADDESVLVKRRRRRGLRESSCYPGNLKPDNYGAVPR